MYDIVKDYYGKQLKTSADLKTSACCDISALPQWLKPLLANIHPDVLAKYYGCGLVCPALMEGLRVLDLGCGSGRDVYALAQLVGRNGHVTGVDMTEEQLAVAQEFHSYHAQEFGYSNTAFEHGFIERLDELDLDPGSFDVIVSNCVVNLSPDKAAVLDQVFRLLKTGGEFYFSDVYADRRLSDTARNDPDLIGECLGGALYWNDFLNLAKAAGFKDPRLVESRPLEITDAALAERAGGAAFYSATYRLFKIDSLEPACEDYGQAVVYRGSIPDHPHAFCLDNHHVMETGRVFPVCGNTWNMLKNTRFAEHFAFHGDFSHHFGIFPGCGTTIPFAAAEPGQDQSGACC